jgi:uncharacterized protein YndB with AHSA1/START domain
MSVLITILIVLGSIIGLLLLIALVLKKDFSLQKEVVIHKPKQEVFNYIKLLKNQEYYSVWVMRDPQVKLVYTGTDGTVGATSAWESNDKNVGAGEQEIKKIAEGESVEVEIRFKKPFEATNNARTIVSLVDGGTKVTNTFYGTSKFPMNIMNLMMEKMVGKDMQQNLLNLKKNLEQ